jgi:hypothetical protein
MCEWIEYKGKKYPFIYNYYAISRLQGSKNSANNAEIFESMVYYAIEAGCEEMDIPFTVTKGGVEKEFTLKDAAFLIGKLTPDYINGLLAKFTIKEDPNDTKKKEIV